MKTIGIYANEQKDKDFIYTRILVDSIRKYGGDIRICPYIAKKANIEVNSGNMGDIYNQSDIIVCLGGDGTFLKAARKVYTAGIPILGINLGSLGFLTEVDKNEIDKAAKCLMEGRYEIEERMMLKVCMKGKNGEYKEDAALNDVVISRGAVSRIVHLNTYVNDSFIDSFPADGLIISSPTGSTAYSLSAGGPIVEPNMNLMIISPICPHILYSRSIIVTEDSVIKVVIAEKSGYEAMVTVDGQKGYDVGHGDIIEVRKSDFKVKMICIKRHNFFNVLRNKIYERGESLKRNEI